MLFAAQKKYYAWDLSHRKSSTDESKFTGVLSEAKVDLNPHQIEAALFAFKSPLSKGAILADEVGLGKTIETGIILSEMWAEHHRKILIVVPASLRNQWNNELAEKFYLPSVVMESGKYNQMQEKEESPFAIDDKIIICSYDFAASHADEINNVQWDLVVFDEAHKLRNVYKKDSVRANILKDALCPYHKLLLTATPLQNNLKELFGLISIIDDEFFSSAKTFEEQYNAVSTRDTSRYGELKARISHILHRTLRSQVQEYVRYTKRIPFVQKYTPSETELKLYNIVTLYLQRPDTIGINDEVRPLLSMLIWKIMSSSTYALSFTLAKIIERLEQIKTKGIIVNSVKAALADFEISSDNEYEIEEEKPLAEVDVQRINKEIAELHQMQELAHSIKTETKAKKLLTALDVAFSKVTQTGGNRKALIFTESCKTQEYLKSFLEEHGYANSVICFNGTNNSRDVTEIYHIWEAENKGSSKITGNILIDKKLAIVDYFHNKAEIMIATEAGAEGINLQFCSLVVNYDMPWNPQRIEQRIGRCHRYGQKNDVVVVNFVNQSNAADRRVYELLDSKFNLFDGVFGSSDEVLGAMDSNLNFEKRLLAIYQKCRTEEEINNAFDNLQKELESIIDERIKQTKKSLLENFDKDVLEKLKFNEEGENTIINEYVNHLWKLSLSILDCNITDINQEDRSFRLIDDMDENILSGSYTLDKHSENKTFLRYTHPLAQYVIKSGLNQELADENIVFSLSSYPFKMALLENHIGERGWLVAYHVNATNSYDGEETIIFCPVTEDGKFLPSDFGKKLMELDAESIGKAEIPINVLNSLARDFDSKLERYKKDLDDRTSEYVTYEIEKYESWSDDKLVPLQNEVIELRKEKDNIHRQSRKERDVKTKLLLKRREMELDTKLRKKQKEMFELEDTYHQQVDNMTSKLLNAMQNKIETSIMFKFGWEII